MSGAYLERPKLRWPLETQYIEHQGERFLVLRDRLQIAAEPAIIPFPLVPVITQFDGSATIDEMAARGAQWGVTVDLLKELCAELHRLRFLESPETIARQQKLHSDFREAPLREAMLAGIVYPAEPRALQAALDRYIQKTEKKLASLQAQESVVALICPHIDYQRGWQGYGAAYSALQQTPPPDIIFLLGTSHQGGESLFQLTKKKFLTPLGELPAATEVIEDLANSYGVERSFRDEFLHKYEHSLELQLPLIMHCFRGGPLPKLVPILVGSFHEIVARNASPFENQELADFVGGLAEVIKSLRLAGKKVLVYGGVDLAHVGIHFGDKERMSSEVNLQRLSDRDNELLACALRSDEEALFRHIAEDSDARRICGFPSMYTMLAALRQAGTQLRGHLIDYRQAVTSENDCIVTFGAACWTEIARD